MTACNRCGGQMLPDDSALIPALACVGCGRLIPRGGMRLRFKGSERAQFSRVRRAARRMKARQP